MLQQKSSSFKETDKHTENIFILTVPSTVEEVTDIC